MREGAIVCKPDRGGTLYTEEEYGDLYGKSSVTLEIFLKLASQERSVNGMSEIRTSAGMSETRTSAGMSETRNS